MWRLYKLNSLYKAVDPSLEGNFPGEEAADVLKIGLLCTQASAADRPVMARVLEMLTNRDSEIPEPNQPPFLNSRAMGSASSSPSYSTNSLVSKRGPKNGNVLHIVGGLQHGLSELGHAVERRRIARD